MVETNWFWRVVLLKKIWIIGVGIIFMYSIAGCAVESPSSSMDIVDTKDGFIVPKEKTEEFSPPVEITLIQTESFVTETDQIIGNQKAEFPCITDLNGVKALVSEIVDGDTIKVIIENEEFVVRYIGIDTPEMSDIHSGAESAKKVNGDLVLGKIITLYKDTSETDRYNRLLKYVVFEKIFINERLVRIGLADAVQFPPDIGCAEYFSNAKFYARQHELGIWKNSSINDLSGGKQVLISNIFYNGFDGINEADEFVEIRNIGQNDINLKDWKLTDNQDHVFFFPDFPLSPNQVCRVFTNHDTVEFCNFNYGFEQSAIWNNGGDCATLLNEKNELVDKYCY
ncbi:MAG: lamin tail domain-containing protein [Anaerolineaceae bacterium]|nr:lamin tail domain-containing protein [Anaerolineaceae bacterium]